MHGHGPETGIAADYTWVLGNGGDDGISSNEKSIQSTSCNTFIAIPNHYVHYTKGHIIRVN